MKYIKFSLLFAAISIFAASCGDSNTATDASNTGEQTETTATAETTQTPDLPEGDVFELTQTGSVVNWKGEYVVVGSHIGTLKFKSGKIIIKDDSVMVGGTFTVDMSTLNDFDLADEPSRKKKLEDHLLSEDFFEADKYPTATLTITQVEPNVPQAPNTENYKVHADLTIKGKTNNVTFLATVNTDGGYLTGGAQFNIDRTQWGVTYHSAGSFADLAKDKVIKDEVSLGIVIEALRISGQQEQTEQTEEPEPEPEIEE